MVIVFQPDHNPVHWFVSSSSRNSSQWLAGLNANLQFTLLRTPMNCDERLQSQTGPGYRMEIYSDKIPAVKSPLPYAAASPPIPHLLS